MSHSPLYQKSVMLIFTYAPAGLGHLRVTDALYHGLPKDVTPIILGSQDEFIRMIHRFTSVSPYARRVFEWMQQGILTDFFTRIYRGLLRTQTNNLYRQMVTVMSQRIEIPQTVVVVATHYGMAQQLGAIKKLLINKLDTRIILAVQVTDDSPQSIWYIPGADIIFVPSAYTKRELIHYGRQEELSLTRFEVNPYPVSPLLSEPLSPAMLEMRKQQLDPQHEGHIHISVPISGAAVGTDFISTLMEELHTQLNTVIFHTVAKSAPFTASFVSTMTRHIYVDLHTSVHDQALVDDYEQLYRHHIIALEITKPSEQTFKVLLEPNQRGGVVLLFTEPVGLQEHDNLRFMQRHHLIPILETHHRLYHFAQSGKALTGNLKEHVDTHAIRWRGIILPADPREAARFITWCYRERLFSRMLEYSKHAHDTDSQYNLDELGSDGVATFWQKVSALL